MQELWDKISVYVFDYGLRVIYACLIFFIGKIVARFATNFVESAMVKSKVDKSLASFSKSLYYFGLMTFVVIAALNKLGIETTSFIAIIGAAGLAVGLALQGSLANFAAGVLLIIFKPFKVGDFIEAAGKLGTVVEIQIFNTVLDHPDNRRMIVPNSKVTGDIVTNFTNLAHRRIDLVFGISYSDDMKKAKETLEKVCAEDIVCSRIPSRPCCFRTRRKQRKHRVPSYVKPADYWAVYSISWKREARS
jgi:small conductance mechanosensitive channel